MTVIQFTTPCTQSALVAIPVQSGDVPVQLLSAWQVRAPFPWSVYPASQVNVAIEPSVVLCMTIPLSMLSTGQLATAKKIVGIRMRLYSKPFLGCKKATSESERV